MTLPERRLPRGSEVFLDHVGHFVPDVHAASDALARAGFLPTPISVQRNRNPDGTDQPSGTGNVAAMLEHGYIEILFKTADTPLGREFDDAISSYPGLHLAAFAVSDAQAQSERLREAGFRVRPVVDLKRPVATEGGETEAAFSVARVQPGEMAEGRMQYLTHHTEEAVWQQRWLTHANGADALLDIVIAVGDVTEASARFARFLFRNAIVVSGGSAFPLERGSVYLVEPEAFRRFFSGVVPRLPFIGLYGVRVAALATAEKLLARNGVRAERHKNALHVPFPPALGLGAWYFVEREIDLPWRSP